MKRLILIVTIFGIGVFGISRYFLYAQPQEALENEGNEDMSDIDLQLADIERILQEYDQRGGDVDIPNFDEEGTDNSITSTSDETPQVEEDQEMKNEESTKDTEAIDEMRGMELESGQE